MKFSSQLILLASILSVLFLSSTTAATAFNPFVAQQITGFTTECTGAYSVYISQCSVDEVTRPAEDGSWIRGFCSAQCANALLATTKTIITECESQRANRTSLIGMFLNRRAVGWLCPRRERAVGPAFVSAETTDGTSTSSAPASSSSDPTAALTTSPGEPTSSSSSISDADDADADADADADSDDDPVDDSDDNDSGGGNPFELTDGAMRAGTRTTSALLFSTTLFWLTALYFGIWA